MKKCLWIALCLLLVLCACGGEKAEFSESDLSLVVDGNTITAETTAQELLAVLGDGYAYAEAISCVYEGMDKTFTYDTMTLYTYPDGETDRLMELYCEGGDVKTAKGITFGATKAEIVAQYGEGYTEAGSILSYELPVSAAGNLPASVYFLLTDGEVTAIAMTAEHRAE